MKTMARRRAWVTSHDDARSLLVFSNCSDAVSPRDNEKAVELRPSQAPQRFDREEKWPSWKMSTNTKVSNEELPCSYEDRLSEFVKWARKMF